MGTAVVIKCSTLPQVVLQSICLILKRLCPINLRESFFSGLEDDQKPIFLENDLRLKKTRVE